jgi:peptidoglycan/xylan/chitin deacetylase (PgdA/CDA1 family)
MVALTFDDGPSGNATPRILEKLKEHNARGTFFMVGQKAEKHKDLIRQMVRQKCEVANHTYDHTLMNKVKPEELASQLERTNQVVSDACGVTPVLMRPCGGVKNEAGMGVVGAISMPAVLWSIDTLDWKTRDPESTIRAVLDHVKDGDIILMHDLYDATADASDTIIPALVERGFQLVTVSELASYRGGMLPGKAYGKFSP